MICTGSSTGLGTLPSYKVKQDITCPAWLVHTYISLDFNLGITILTDELNLDGGCFIHRNNGSYFAFQYYSRRVRKVPYFSLWALDDNVLICLSYKETLKRRYNLFLVPARKLPARNLPPHSSLPLRRIPLHILRRRRPSHLRILVKNQHNHCHYLHLVNLFPLAKTPNDSSKRPEIQYRNR